MWSALMPQKRVQQWTVEPVIDVHVLRVLQEREQRWTAKYSLDVLVLRDVHDGVCGETDRIVAWSKVADNGTRKTNRTTEGSEIVTAGGAGAKRMGVGGSHKVLQTKN